VQAVGGHGQRLDLASRTGTNAVSIAPVVASKARMLLRAIAVVGAAALATRVNWPPATILLPTWTMAATFRTAADTSANRTRRPMSRRFPSLTSSGTARL
jgi:hypothetical protein